MTDDLVNRLMSAPADGLGTENLCIEAADRIEELEAKLRQEIKDRERVERVWGDNYAALEAKLELAVDALDEAVYLLRPDDEDMMRQQGVYRIVTTLAELKGQADE